MNGPIAQIVALACYGNAMLRGSEVPRFFPDNSTCQFCDSVTFVEGTGPSRVILAETPDQWLLSLSTRAATALKLLRTPSNLPLRDRTLAGLVGGGGIWTVEVALPNGCSELWTASWSVWDRNAPKRKIWRVRYGMVQKKRTVPSRCRALAEVKADLTSALTEIHQFSTKVKLSHFARCFEGGLEALANPDADIAYHKDLWPPGELSSDARSLLKAAMSAWVFGAMGSWNDVQLQQDARAEYERVSDKLFQTLTEAIEAAATSSAGES